MRTAVRLDGLAVAGRATVGPVGLEIPTVLGTLAPGEEADGPGVRPKPSAPGTRVLAISAGGQEADLAFPILAPEIAPPTGGVTPLGETAALLHPPCSAEALSALRARRPELLVLGNARALWNDGEALVAAVRAVRTFVGSEPLVWAPRVALPHRLPLLAYLGLDLLDTTEGELRAAAGEFLDPTLGGRTEPGEPGPRACDCASCGASPPGTLRGHARAMYRRAELEVRSAIAHGTLRELVEARLVAEPALAELLRYADRDLAELLEARSPVVGGPRRTYVLAESVRRPEMRRFRERLIERYRPPASKTVLLLVPCSRTKPYRNSPSHRRFEGALVDLPGAHRVHLVSVSSPIGVVPRELEDVPPARHYDIPVTGDWTAEERAVVLRGLAHLLATGAYRRAVVHLDGVEYGFLVDAIPAALRLGPTVVDGRATSPASLARLREAVAAALAEDPGRPAGPMRTVVEELREVASVQFGRVAAERLFAPPTRLLGRPWFQRLTDGRSDLASLREERGLFHVTLAGADRLGETLARVEVDAALSLEGDVFAPGVRSADPGIRVGDPVGVVQAGVVSAVGEAALPGPLLGDLRHGLAVRIRHRRHAPADTAKTASSPPPMGR